MRVPAHHQGGGGSTACPASGGADTPHGLRHLQFFLGNGCFFGLCPVGNGQTYGFGHVNESSLRPSRDPANSFAGLAASPLVAPGRAQISNYLSNRATTCSARRSLPLIAVGRGSIQSPSIKHITRGTQIPIAHAAPSHHLPRFPPLEVFGRWPTGARDAIRQWPASENLHNSGRIKPCPRVRSMSSLRDHHLGFSRLKVSV
jgi:hypothetical protein